MALYETASYEVLKEYDKHMELRKYPVYYLAQTTSQLDTRYSNGFGTVFNYISGNNFRSIENTKAIEKSIAKDDKMMDLLMTIKEDVASLKPKNNK